MKSRRKLLLRTEILESIRIRRKDAKTNFPARARAETYENPKRETYRLEIYSIKAGSRQKVYKCEIHGSIEIVEFIRKFEHLFQP